jgi:hypothetical protein
MGEGIVAPFAGIIRIRFNGSSAFRAKLSAFVVPADGRLAPRTSEKLGSFARSVKQWNSARLEKTTAAGRQKKDGGSF